MTKFDEYNTHHSEMLYLHIFDALCMIANSEAHNKILAERTSC